MIENAWVAWLILLLPLAAFVIIGLLGRWLRDGSGYVAVAAMLGSLVLSLYVFVQVLAQGAIGGNFAAQTIAGYVWLPSIPGNEIRISLLIDNLSSLMLVLVSFLCLLIFIYSLGYMHEEEGKPRYYAEVSLFATGMLGTVSADNFLQLLIFWEIMGLCSYLLIGFWYHKPEAAAAAKKAFLVTRVGDVLFLIGVLVIWNEFGTLRFNEIAPRVGLLSPQLLTLIPLLLFGGAVGKSAQFPLHAWLPDAMEGPTTVSALIHAATMVKAGVYLTARSFIFLVPLAPGVQPPFTAILVIAGIGGFTAIFAATMAVVNNDIKRVLAFSTISQLAYMFLGLGAGAYVMATEAVNGEPVNSAGYSAALYHLFNHAFFKALLFLSAGSVIHAVHTNDMREMGGLSKSMPITSRVMLFGSLALAGIIPFSGFFSKGEVLSVTFDAGADHPGFYLLYLLGLSTAFLTAFYAFRLWFMTFHGERAPEPAHAEHPARHEALEHPARHPAPQHPAPGTHLHDAPPAMAIALIMLAIGSVFAGYVGLSGRFERFLEPSFAVTPEVAADPSLETSLMVVSSVVALVGIGLAVFLFLKRRAAADRLAAQFAGLHRVLERKYYVDEIYDAALVQPVRIGSDEGLWKTLDVKLIDGAVNGVAEAVRGGSESLRRLQTGSVRAYAVSLFLGVVMVLGYYLWR